MGWIPLNTQLLKQVEHFQFRSLIPHTHTFNE